MRLSLKVAYNVLRLWEVADLISEFSPKPQTKLIKINIQLLQNPQFLKAVVTCLAQNGIFFFFLFFDKFPFKLFPRHPAPILRNPFPTIFYGLQLRKILKNLNKKRKKKKMRLQLRHISVAFSQRGGFKFLAQFFLFKLAALFPGIYNKIFKDFAF